MTGTEFYNTMIRLLKNKTEDARKSKGSVALSKEATKYFEGQEDAFAGLLRMCKDLHVRED